MKADYRELIPKEPKLEVVEFTEFLVNVLGATDLGLDWTASACCGFGGTFAVKFEPISVGMGEQKVLNAVLASGGDTM